jgi:hypothetical protein
MDQIPSLADALEARMDAANGGSHHAPGIPAIGRTTIGAEAGSVSLMRADHGSNAEPASPKLVLTCKYQSNLSHRDRFQGRRWFRTRCDMLLIINHKILPWGNFRKRVAAPFGSWLPVPHKACDKFTALFALGV